NAMRIFHEAGVRTTCFISPIFPGITDVKAIIMKAKDYCNLIWLENLNLRGDYRGKILNWIHEKHPELDSLYHEIYSHKNLSYWFNLNDEIKALAESLNLPYVRNDDSMKRDFDDPPVIVNYFFHEQITR
ncbi:MAG: radical SAM protein, partial [Synergistaceae bacterium]|nr:radical SAM protein [Synergistaceae bacterium]